MKNWITTGLVYETEICGKTTTCLYKFIGAYTEEELNNKIETLKKETGLNLRAEEVEPIETCEYTYTHK